MKLALIFLAVCALIISGCSSSYDDCKYDCRDIKMEAICPDEYGIYMIVGEDSCMATKLNESVRNSISAQCFEECKGG